MRHHQRRRLLPALLIATAALLSPLVVVATAGAGGLSRVTRTWTEPAGGYAFLRSAIVGSRTSLDLSMYELKDPAIERDLEARAAAGVDVRVLLDYDYYGASDNAAAFAALRASRVHVEWAPPHQIFHAKYLVVDGDRAYVGTGNLVTEDYPTTRDFWVEDTTPRDVAAMTATFDGDFAGRSGVGATANGLLWSPGSTNALVSLIGDARHSLLVENEEMDSPAIESALANAARRGVVVKIAMTNSSSWLTALSALARAGVRVSLLSASQVYVHAKVICVDCTTTGGTVFLGSENFSTSSLSYNRELGVVTTSPNAVRAVRVAVEGDWADGTKLVNAPTTAPPTVSTVTITSLLGSIAPGAEDTLSARSPRAGDHCALSITLPSGYTSESSGLGATTANASGVATWTWRIGSTTDPGTATATVTCGAGTARRDFTIT